jgi:hypothetical protein
MVYIDSEQRALKIWFDQTSDSDGRKESNAPYHIEVMGLVAQQGYHVTDQWDSRPDDWRFS